MSKKNSLFASEGVDAIVNAITDLVHPQAKYELDRTKSALVAWVRARLQQLSVLGVDEVHLSLNPYNQTHDLGLQSVRLAIFRAGIELRGDGEFQSPTVGVIANGMLDAQGGMAVKSFEVGDGCAEVLSLLSPLRIADSTMGLQDVQSAGSEVRISGPQSAHVVIQATTVGAGEVTDLQVMPGVYVCCYVHS